MSQEWTTTLAVLGFCLWAYVLWALHRLIRRVPNDILRFVRRELAFVLPLPQVDRDDLRGLLIGMAPGRALSVFTAGEPPLRVVERPGLGGEIVALAETVHMMSHRDLLAAGVTVQEDDHWLVPLRSQAGRLVGVVMVAGIEPLAFTQLDRLTLDLLAGHVGRAWMLSEYAAYYLTNWRWEDLALAQLPGPPHGHPSKQTQH